ncbi:MAG: helix-turn-helix transcriptional regulator [bacterium]|nr:helix-turn-helix transcriptional regulator [bacterium]
MATLKDENITKELSDKLKKAREKCNLTQDEVAEQTGISSNYYAKIERGEINVTIKKLYKIIKVLKINPSDIFSS